MPGANIRTPMFQSPRQDQPLQAVEVVNVLDARRFRDAQSGQAAEEDRQHRVELQSRQWRADAEMDAGAEGEVRRLLAVRLEDERVRELPGVAIGRGADEDTLVAPPERDAVDPDLLPPPALAHVSGGATPPRS